MAAEPPAALLPIAMAMLLPLVLLLVVMRELRVLLQCATRTWRAVHGHRKEGFSSHRGFHSLHS